MFQKSNLINFKHGTTFKVLKKLRISLLFEKKITVVDLIKFFSMTTLIKNQLINVDHEHMSKYLITS